jgi:hypothetical protein
MKIAWNSTWCQAKRDQDSKTRLFYLLAGLSFCLVPSTQAGPPFVTDDPEPVEYRHWEVYFASQLGHDADGWSGTLPHLEINYGAIPDLQLHLIAPLAFVAPKDEPTHFGYGDMELGVKYRLVQETSLFPQIGVFPLAELPTGDRNRGLGGGEMQVFLPVWFQKSWGPERRLWTTYGGGGYWINPGADNRDWTLIGWLLQRQVADNLTVGAEAFYETARTVGEEDDIMFNAGGIFNINETYHLLFSAGHTIRGPARFSAYLALQLTVGRDR